MSISNHLRSILALPFTATIIIPGIILYATRTINIGWSLASPVNVLPLMLGALLILGGLGLLIQTIALFVTVGKGTLAPWEPTQKLVVRGVYRYVRNPMISGVMAILLGETILFGSIALLYWFIAFVLVNAIYMPLFEEPGLAQRFGDDYIRYKQNVPRWIPRLKPWDAPANFP